MARKIKSPTTILPPVQPAISEPVTMAEASFSPQALSNLLNEITAQRKELADLKEQMIQDNKRKMATPAPVAASPKLSVAGKTDKALANEILCVKLFKKQGYSDIRPHINVKTFNRWMAEGRRPIEGSKSVRVANLRLFHVLQTRPVTSEEKAKNKAQQQAAVARHDAAAKADAKANGKAKGKPGNVVPLTV